MIYFIHPQIIRMHFLLPDPRIIRSARGYNRDRTTPFCSFSSLNVSITFFLFSLILDSIKPYELHQTSPCWSLKVSIYFVLSLTLDNVKLNLMSCIKLLQLVILGVKCFFVFFVLLRLVLDNV